ncbi:MAG TPA: class I SAM-dependent methyltransferase [Miltoncostaeaceae bacterium]|nr:class I SAM-dependent methyltransferase [Miltoncostaeaceae bacterium]
MSLETSIQRHYTRPGLLDGIRDAIRAAGGDPARPTLDDLAPYDEFHLGGREATRMLITRLAAVVRPGARVLDVGCGLGGPARVLAHETGCEVVGVDLTEDFVAAGTALTAAAGLADRVRLVQGSATALPLDDGTVDAAWQLHVGMNLPDKAAVAREVHRVLRPGGVFVVYDLMGAGNGVLTFPVPWASEPAFSAVESPAAYRGHLEGAGLRVVDERDHRDVAVRFFDAMRDRMAQGLPPMLRPDVFVGSAAAERFANLGAAVRAGRITPVEMVAVRPG